MHMHVYFKLLHSFPYFAGLPGMHVQLLDPGWAGDQGRRCLPRPWSMSSSLFVFTSELPKKNFSMSFLWSKKSLLNIYLNSYYLYLLLCYFICIFGYLSPRSLFVSLRVRTVISCGLIQSNTHLWTALIFYNASWQNAAASKEATAIYTSILSTSFRGSFH